MDWLFLFQTFLVIIVWVLFRYLYRHSAWLSSNKPITIPIYRFPKFIIFVEKLINKYHVLVYIVVVPTVLITFVGVFFLLIIVGMGAANAFNSFLDSQTWWEQVLTFSCLVISYFGVRFWWDEKENKRSDGFGKYR